MKYTHEDNEKLQLLYESSWMSERLKKLTIDVSEQDNAVCIRYGAGEFLITLVDANGVEVDQIDGIAVEPVIAADKDLTQAINDAYFNYQDIIEYIERENERYKQETRELHLARPPRN